MDNFCENVKRCLRPFGFEGMLLLKISQVGSCATCPSLLEIISTKGALREAVIYVLAEFVR